MGTAQSLSTTCTVLFLSNDRLRTKFLKRKNRELFGSRSLLLRNHQHVAVSALYVDDLRCPYTVAAAGADIFDAVAIGVAGPCRLACSVSCASASRRVAVLHSVHLDILPALL